MGLNNLPVLSSGLCTQQARKGSKNRANFISGHIVSINLQIQGFWPILLEVMARTWSQNEIVYCLLLDLNFNTCHWICGVRNLPSCIPAQSWSSSQTWYQGCTATSMGPGQFCLHCNMWLSWYKYTILCAKTFPSA